MPYAIICMLYALCAISYTGRTKRSTNENKPRGHKKRKMPARPAKIDPNATNGLPKGAYRGKKTDNDNAMFLKR